MPTESIILKLMSSNIKENATSKVYVKKPYTNYRQIKIFAYFIKRKAIIKLFVIYDFKLQYRHFLQIFIPFSFVNW